VAFAASNIVRIVAFAASKRVVRTACALRRRRLHMTEGINGICSELIANCANIVRN
jgi:hypothetical protein